MKIITHDNATNHTKVVFIKFKTVVHKIVYDCEGNKMTEEELCAYCPMCKHFCYCDGSKVWYVKQLEECGDFETE